jgi:hypothetical protein
MSHDQEQSIQEQAYLIWEREGRPHGRTLAHWLLAEAELARQADAAVVKAGTPKNPPAVRTRRPRAAAPRS